MGIRVDSGGCDCGDPHLTSREGQILWLIAQGNSVGEVSRVLRLSPRTVEDHLARLRRRTGARNAVSLITLCFAAKILLPGWPPQMSGSRCLRVRDSVGCG